jgi:hypothetical protein
MVQSLWEANKSSASQETPAFYGTWRFIITFTRAHHLSMFSARPTQSISLSHSLQILFFYFPPIYASVLQVIFPSDFPTKILYATPIHATCPANLVLLDFIKLIICGEHRSYSSLLCNLLRFCCFILLRPKLSSSAPYAPKPQSIIKVLLPTDAHENCFKRNIKIYIKTAPTCFNVITIIKKCTIWACYNYN